MPSTSAPHSLARCAITGDAPVPVPPPMPAAMKITSAPSQSDLSLAASSSAAARPRSGSPPAPMPRVSFSPSTILFPTSNCRSAAASVFSAINSTPSKGVRAMWFTALPPAPPTPNTLMRKLGFTSAVDSFGVMRQLRLKKSVMVCLMVERPSPPAFFFC